jgi:demethylmenaquinone methyltransferase / 2-methoxy-6-polyprenyl-1,4-benzoquinol methylase
MGSEYYAPGAGRAQKVKTLFARIASRYDLINDLQSFGMHRWWKRQVVRLAGLEAEQFGLDVCCGTGDLAFALARAGAGVYGVDFCAPMLEVAAQRKLKLLGKHLPPLKVEFVQGDALHLPFPDNRFQAVTVAYGLRNLSDWQAGLREMWRVAKPGGRLLALDFGKPDNPAWRWFYYQYLRLFVPVLGWVFCGDSAAYAYILESLKHYPAQHGVAQAMRDLGCREVRILNLLGGVMTINAGLK